MSANGNGMRAHEDNGSMPRVHIVVMGGTGVGKSSFTQLLLGHCNKEKYPDIVGHQLKCFTKDVLEYRFELEGRQGSIFDTPGFDDDGLDEGEVLAKLAGHFKSTCESDFKVTAIFYFHDITRSRFSGSQIRMLDVFEKLCGPKSLHNVVIVTTKWDRLPKDDTIAEKLEAELLRDHMAILVKSGAKSARHDNSIESVLQIVRPVMLYAATKTRIQEELVDERKDLKDTEAGKRVAQDLSDKIDKMQRDWDKEKRLFEEKIEESSKEWAEMLKSQREKDAEDYKTKLDKLQRDLDEMKSSKPGWLGSSLQALPTIINAMNETVKLYNNIQGSSHPVSGENLFNIFDILEEKHKMSNGFDQI